MKRKGNEMEGEGIKRKGNEMEGEGMKRKGKKGKWKEDKECKVWKQERKEMRCGETGWRRKEKY